MQLFNILLLSGVGIKIAQFLIALSLLILLHEAGHFFFARLFKTRVEKFYLFFDFLFPFPGLLNFSLFKKKKGDTEYGLGWFPLGGYVKIAGMVDESMDREALAQPPQPWEFRSKKAWQRLLIMLGGILVNVLVAIVIYAMILFVWGEKKLPLAQMRDGIFVADSIGYKLGFETGDKIIAINGKPLQYFEDVMPELLYAQTVQLERDGRTMTLNMPVNFIEQLIDNKARAIFMSRIPTVVGKVAKGTGAEAAGLKQGDRITGINGNSTPYFDQLKTTLDSLKGTQIALHVVRDEKPMMLTAQVSDSGTLGFMPQEPTPQLMEQLGLYQYETKRYGLLASFPAGVRMAGDKLAFYAKQFKLFFNPKTGAYKGIGGFASMTSIFPDYWDWQVFWSITAFFSIVLAFMNLLPIPGLDGGYVFFLLFEMITGRKVSDKVMEKATAVGLVLLLALMVYANGMDIFRIFKG
jgi:regulator of sigma E protease